MMERIFKFALIFLVVALSSCTTIQKTVEPTEPIPTPKIKSKGNSRIGSFNKAKKLLTQLYSKGAPTTFYCGCRFSGKVVDWNSCGYKPKGSKKRAARIEWEHVVPAADFGGRLTSWASGHSDCKTKSGKTYKGRRCASKVNAKFNFMEADLYNLKPTIGEVNGLRSNYGIGIISGEKRLFGKCDVEIENKTVEPRPEIRGDVARVYLYMDAAYPGFEIVNASNRELIQKWDREDPVSTDECERTKGIEKIQGNTNGILAFKCSKLQIRD